MDIRVDAGQDPNEEIGAAHEMPPVWPDGVRSTRESYCFARDRSQKPGRGDRVVESVAGFALYNEPTPCTLRLFR